MKVKAVVVKNSEKIPKYYFVAHLVTIVYNNIFAYF